MIDIEDYHIQIQRTGRLLWLKTPIHLCLIIKSSVHRVDTKVVKFLTH